MTHSPLLVESRHWFSACALSAGSPYGAKWNQRIDLPQDAANEIATLIYFCDQTVCSMPLHGMNGCLSPF